jgi:exopolysaccharide biosynthesis polyprenyl glycosylphosphotransferase
MIRLRHKLLTRLLIVFDQVMLLGTFAAIVYFRPEVWLKGGAHWSQASFKLSDTLSILLLSLGWVVIFGCLVRYKADRFVAIRAQLRDLVAATTLAAFLLVLVGGTLPVRSVNPSNVAIFWGVVTGLGISSRLLLRGALLRVRKSGYNSRYLLVIGVNQRALDLARKIESRPELGYKITGFIAETPSAREEYSNKASPPTEVLGCLDQLQSVLKAERIDEMMVCLPIDARFSDIALVIKHARDLGVVVRVMPQFRDDYLLGSLRVEEFEGHEVITLFREQMLFQLLIKRLADIGISLVALLVLSPVMIVTAVAIKLTSPGPVLFVQNRVGMNQRTFQLYKFRSMVVDAEDRKQDLAHLNEVDGPVFKIGNDPRVTRIGRLIRRTSIDELPQLFNVLQGEMSLVGPRPPLPDEVSRYEWLFRKRLSVKPGITCVWQVSGRNNVSFERWMQMDHDYVENWSLWLDMKILMKTLPAVFMGKGAS